MVCYTGLRTGTQEPARQGERGRCQPEVATIRHLSPTTLVQKLRALCLTQLRADLAVVLDCTDLAALGLDEDDLLRDGDYAAGRALTHAAREHGAEALLLPSATRIGEMDARVLIVFPDRPRPGSAVRVVKIVRPTLAPPT